MTAATVAFLMPVKRFSSGVYSTVAAALIAMTDRSADWPCAHEPPPQLMQQIPANICTLANLSTLTMEALIYIFVSSSDIVPASGSPSDC